MEVILVEFVTAPALSSEAVPDAPIAIRLDNQGNQFRKRNDRDKLLVKLRDRAGLEELSSSSMASMASRKGRINNWVNFRSVITLFFKDHVSCLIHQFHVKKCDKYLMTNKKQKFRENFTHSELVLLFKGIFLTYTRQLLISMRR